MRVVLVGAQGTIGSAVDRMLVASGAEVVRVGRSSGEHRLDIADRAKVAEFYSRIGAFDAVVNAAGKAAFGPLAELSSEKWSETLGSKLLGQVHLVQEALPFIRERGSFTLVSGVTSDEPIFGGVAMTTVNRAVEGFVQSAAVELPKGLRINVISPTVLTESAEKYAKVFPGFVPVDGDTVAQAYKKSIYGVSTGQIYRVS